VGEHGNQNLRIIQEYNTDFLCIAIVSSI